MSDRAAQFSPFSALSGHSAAIKETARQTEGKVCLSDDTTAYLSEQLTMLQARLDEHLTVSITYFMPDKKKSGGAYVRHSGTVKKIDEYERVLVMQDKTVIPIDEIVEIETEDT